MNIKELLKIPANLIGRQDISDFLEDKTGETEVIKTDVNLLLRCLNIVINEVVTERLALKKSEVLSSNNGRFYFKDLAETPIKIISVKSGNVAVNYKTKEDYFEANALSVTVEYTFAPKTLTLTGELPGGLGVIPARILAYGTAAEYCIVKGVYDGGNTWREKFESGLKNLLIQHNAIAKARSFV